MARWADLATWRGPIANQGGTMLEHRGVVVHIAEGSFEGTISWQRNPDAQVSSHFIVSKTGQIAQMVDTNTTAWTQRAGNGHWLSIENEGFTPNGLTAAQIDANARILARAHTAYGVPLQLAADPTGKGLGHHSMGGTAWGHLDCPGPAIIAQKPAILAAAIALLNPPQEEDMTPDQAAQLKQVYNAVFFGGPSMGPAAPVKINAASNSNALVDLIQALRTDTAALKAQLAALSGKDFVDEQAIARDVLAGLSPTAIADAVAAALPPTVARQVVDQLAARLGEAGA